MFLISKSILYKYCVTNSSAVFFIARWQSGILLRIYFSTDHKSPFLFFLFRFRPPSSWPASFKLIKGEQFKWSFAFRPFYRSDRIFQKNKISDGRTRIAIISQDDGRIQYPPRGFQPMEWSPCDLFEVYENSAGYWHGSQGRRRLLHGLFLHHDAELNDRRGNLHLSDRGRGQPGAGGHRQPSRRTHDGFWQESEAGFHIPRPQWTLPESREHGQPACL